jgi:hypothetical protein
MDTSCNVGAISPHGRWNVWVSGRQRSTSAVNKELFTCNLRSTIRARGSSPAARNLVINLEQKVMSQRANDIGNIEAEHVHMHLPSQRGWSLHASPGNLTTNTVWSTDSCPTFGAALHSWLRCLPWTAGSNSSYGQAVAPKPAWSVAKRRLAPDWKPYKLARSYSTINIYMFLLTLCCHWFLKLIPDS